VLKDQECKCETILDIGPVLSYRTEKKTRAFMVESTVHFNVAGERRVEGLPLRDDPV
jgi:hypothetical protein